MKNQFQYMYSCTNAIFNYLNKGEDLDTLLKDLIRIENHAHENIGGEDCTLWFKFGHDDTLATDIRDIRNDLMTYRNRDLIIDKFKRVTRGINPQDELRVFYS